MRSRVIAPVLVVLLAVLMSGCSSDEEPESGSTDAATTSSAATTAAATDATDASADASAASGEQVQLEHTLKFRVPDEYDWLIDDSGDSILATAVVDGGVLDISSHDVLNDDDSLDDTASVVIDTWNEDTSATYLRTRNRTVAGVLGFVIEGKRNDTLLLEFGTLHNGRLVTLDLNYPETFDSDTAADVFAAVLASIEWK